MPIKTNTFYQAHPASDITALSLLKLQYQHYRTQAPIMIICIEHFHY